MRLKDIAKKDYQVTFSGSRLIKLNVQNLQNAIFHFNLHFCIGEIICDYYW